MEAAVNNRCSPTPRAAAPLDRVDFEEWNQERYRSRLCYPLADG